MDPKRRHFRKPWMARWRPRAGRPLLWLTMAALIVLAAPADAQQAAGSTYGPVRRADTLWELALRFRGDANVNAQQVMIAILRANPEAFLDGNINALRTGVTLRVPTAAEMASISAGEAAAEFVRHEEAWRNRRRTGSAAPGPRPQTAARPAAPSPGDKVAEELREARATVTELRERLSERDEAIEDLLVQLAAVQRELREIQRAAAPAPPAESAPVEDEAPGASWLPVSPLILGSSLIVLLVLIVVVTLLRQRGGAEETLDDEPGEEGMEEVDDEPGGDAQHERAQARVERHPEGGEAAEVEPPPRPSRAGRAAGAAVATAAAAAPGDGIVADDEGEDLEGEDETADLPIGMDLEGEEEWEPAPEESTEGQPESRDRDTVSELGRHVEVGELDDLELDVDAGAATFADIPADLEERDDRPKETGSGRPRRGRRK